MELSSRSYTARYHYLAFTAKNMNIPTEAQLRKLYELCHTLTNLMLQPIHIVRLDERTGNLFVLAGRGETIEIEVKPSGEFKDEPD